jgi:hypothetical protein
VKYKVEYGKPIYRGNHCCTKSKVFSNFNEVVKQIMTSPVMLVEHVGNKLEILYYWEEGWISDSLTKQEKKIVVRSDKNHGK